MFSALRTYNHKVNKESMSTRSSENIIYDIQNMEKFYSGYPGHWSRITKTPTNIPFIELFINTIKSQPLISSQHIYFQASNLYVNSLLPRVYTNKLSSYIQQQPLQKNLEEKLKKKLSQIYNLETPLKIQQNFSQLQKLINQSVPLISQSRAHLFGCFLSQNRKLNSQIIALIKTTQDTVHDVYIPSESSHHQKNMRKQLNKKQKLQDVKKWDVFEQIRNKIQASNSINQNFQYYILDQKRHIMQKETQPKKLFLNPGESFEPVNPETLTQEQAKKGGIDHEVQTLEDDRSQQSRQLNSKYQALLKKYEKIYKEKNELALENQELSQQSQEIWQRLKNLDIKSVERKKLYEQNLEKMMNGYEQRIAQILELVGQNSVSIQMDVMKDQAERLGILLDQKNKCIQKLRFKINTLESNVKQLTEYNDTLHGQLEKICSQLSNNSQIKSLNKNEGKQKNNALIQEIQNFKKINSELTQENKNLTGENADLQMKIQSLQSNLSSRIAKLKLDSKNHLQEIDSLQKINQNLIAEIHQLKIEKNASFSKYLEENKKKVEISLEQKKCQDEIEQELRETLSKNNKLERTISDMTFEFNKLKGCIEKFKEERFTLLANNRILKETLNQYQTSNRRHRYHSTEPIAH